MLCSHGVVSWHMYFLVELVILLCSNLADTGTHLPGTFSSFIGKRTYMSWDYQLLVLGAFLISDFSRHNYMQGSWITGGQSLEGKHTCFLYFHSMAWLMTGNGTKCFEFKVGRTHACSVNQSIAWTLFPRVLFWPTAGLQLSKTETGLMIGRQMEAAVFNLWRSKVMALTTWIF